MLVRSGSIDLIVIDSVAALVPRAEIEGEMGDSHVGLQARLMSQALRKLTGGLSQTNTTMIFINQLREKIGVFFGSPETTAGGKALKFYASVRLDIRRIETLKDGTDAVGNRTRVKVVKNKMAPPFKQAEFDILYGVGISREGSLIDFGVEHEIVKKSGAWYTYDGDQLGQGKENARNFLLENPDIAARDRDEDPAASSASACRKARRGRRGRRGAAARRSAERRSVAPQGAADAATECRHGRTRRATDAGVRGRAARPRHLPVRCAPAAVALTPFACRLDADRRVQRRRLGRRRPRTSEAGSHGRPSAELERRRSSRRGRST